MSTQKIHILKYVVSCESVRACVCVCVCVYASVRVYVRVFIASMYHDFEFLVMRECIFWSL